MTILMNGHPECGNNDNCLPQLLRLTDVDKDTRSRSLLLLLAGLAVTLLLFVLLPLTQAIADILRPPITTPAPVVVPPPPAFVEPDPPKPEPKDEVVKPELIKEVPRVPMDLINVNNTGGPGATIPGVAWNPEDVIPKVFEPGDLDRPPAAIFTVAPDYPPALVRDRIEGSVTIEFIVTPQGNVTALKIVSSTRREFEQPAVKAVSRWRFEPGLKDGSPVATRMQLPLRFSLAR